MSGSVRIAGETSGREVVAAGETGYETSLASADSVEVGGTVAVADSVHLEGGSSDARQAAVRESVHASQTVSVARHAVEVDIEDVSGVALARVSVERSVGLAGETLGRTVAVAGGA